MKQTIVLSFAFLLHSTILAQDAPGRPRIDSLTDPSQTIEALEGKIAELNNRFEKQSQEEQIRQQKNRIRHQNFVVIGLIVFLLLAALLVRSNYRHFRLAKETQLQAEIRKQHEMAMKAVMVAEENERQRIARDLHDGIGQMLSAAKMNLSAFQSGMQFTNDEQKKSLETIIRLVDESCKEVRTVSHIMMPNALLKNNLDKAIREFVNKLPKKELEVHVSTQGLEDRFDANVETVLYRVVQESVTNAIKHSNATNLDISLIRDKDGISGTIEDNGKGFDVNDTEHSPGIGLKNIATRIGYLKGTVDIDSSPGKGTLIALHIPLNPSSLAY